LVANPAAAEAILRNYLSNYIPVDWPDRHDARLQQQRDAAVAAMFELLGSK
jgi:hypothetical protein